MKENKEIERILLNDKNYEKFMNTKIQKEFEEITKGTNSAPAEEIADINKVSSSDLFDKRAIYLVMNKLSRTKSYINGIQAEGFLGSDEIQRKKLLSKEADYFVSGDRYIKFFKFGGN